MRVKRAQVIERFYHDSPLFEYWITPLAVCFYSITFLNYIDIYV